MVSDNNAQPIRKVAGADRLLAAVLLNDTIPDRHHGCTLVGRTIDQLTGANRIAIIARSPVHHDWRSNPDVCAAMQRADLVIVNGEGTIHHDRPAGQALLAAGPWCKERGIPSALINMTWQNNSDELADQLRQFSFVSVRETSSSDEIRKFGLSPFQAPDLALYAAHTDTQPRSLIGVTDSVLPGVTEQLDILRRRIGGRHISILYGRNGARDWFRTARKYGASITGSPARTLSAIAAGHRERRSQTQSADSFVAEVARCRLLITGRFHAVIVAMATKTPFLAVASNSHKIESTVRDAGLDDFRVAPAGDIDDSVIERASLWSDSELSNLNGYVESGRRKITAMFSSLRGLA